MTKLKTIIAIGTIGLLAIGGFVLLNPPEVRGYSTENLVGYWKMDDNLATTQVLDSSAGNHHGTLNDNTNTHSVVSLHQRALTFDGSDDYIKVTDNFVADPTALTMLAWFKKESGGSNYECVIHKSSDATIGNSDYWLGVDLNDYLTATIGANTSVGWAAGQTTTTATYGQWYHLAATWDGSVVIVYIDGAYNKQYNLSTYTNLNTDTRFGASSDGLNYQFKGEIDEVRIYDRALSADEIALDYFLGSETRLRNATLKNCNIK